MSDQPPVVDHDNDRPPDHESATGRRPTDHAPLSLEEAADHLGITVNAVRQRLKRGTLQGDRTSGGWVVFLSTDQATTGGAGRRPTDRPAGTTRPATNRPPDQAPLADLIADLARRNEELAAAAALWQYRAMQAEERLAQLEAGPIADEASDVPQERDPGPVRDDVAGVRAPETLLGRVRRLIGR